MHHRLDWFAGAVALGMLTAFAQADPPKDEPAKKPVVQLPVGNLEAKDWLKFSTQPLKAGEIDQMINAELTRVKITPAPLTTDEQFIRRAYVDLTGKLPTPTEVSDFVADKSSTRRAKLIDKLLDSEDYATHWGNYWRTVITTRATIDFRLIRVVPEFERWMAAQYKANKSWAVITREMLTASGKIMYTETDKNAQAFFLLSRRGMDSPTEMAAETSRIFLGIQIQCAQCHDHPSDVWKRHQFHELAAYFARYRGERPIFEEKKIVGVQLASQPFGEHKMPARDDPKQSTTMMPKFLDGKSPPGVKIVNGGGKGGFGKGGFGGLSDEARRKALTDQIIDKNNPWFAGAFVNRMWGELMGQSFYSPIDDLGPQKDAMMPAVLARVAGSFRGSDYDVKQLFRDIMTSDAYQRQIRPGELGEDHLLFATRNPVRMNGNAMWQSLTSTLGPIGPAGGKFGAALPKGPFGRFGGVEQLVKNEFSYDPSTKAEEIEGSISQALLLMNNPQINARIKAQGNTLLAQVLATHTEDNEALRVVYLRALGRRPTDREVTRLRQHVASVNNRAEAYEDILWALINSTEFQMKR